MLRYYHKVIQEGLRPSSKISEKRSDDEALRVLDRDLLHFEVA